MSRGTLNKVILIGRLGKDPEMRYTPQGVAVTTFNIATNESYKDKEGKEVENTEWHRVVTWRKLAEICGQYLKKGSLVYIEGKLKTRTYDDKDGVKKYITETIADQMQMLDSKRDSGGGSERSTSSHDTGSMITPSEPSSASSAEDDLPF